MSSHESWQEEGPIYVCVCERVCVCVERHEDEYAVMNIKSRSANRHEARHEGGSIGPLHSRSNVASLLQLEPAQFLYNLRQLHQRRAWESRGRGSKALLGV